MSTSNKPNAAVISSLVERRIFRVRGHKVMIDSDLAQLYDVSTGDFNRAVRRNAERFPPSFMFELTKDEWASLRCQIGISNDSKRGGRRYAPLVFTEHGVAMLSSILNSSRAIQVNILIIETFVRLRELTTGNEQILRRLDVLEQKTVSHDAQLKQVFQALRDLLTPPAAHPKRRIGIRTNKNEAD